MPARAMRTLAPGLIPVSLSLTGAFSEVPLDMVLIQICIPFTAHRINIRCGSQAHVVPTQFLDALHCVQLPCDLPSHVGA